MIPYVYILGGPILILVINYLVTNPRPRILSEYVDVILRSLPHLFGYMFFLYYLGNEEIAYVGWGPITLFTFLIPITVIVLLLKLYFLIRGKIKHK